MPEYIDRKGTQSVKWDCLKETFGAEGLLPLWVADMDFRVDSSIEKAISDYVKEGVFGYYSVPDSYYESFIDWERERHGFNVEKDWIRFSPGVVSGFNFAVQVLTEPGDAIMVNTPVYYPFHHAVQNNGRRLICSELVNRDGRYFIDFEDFERRIIDENVKAFIMCSPHNPVSRVWTAEEIKKLLKICRTYGVAVISDEIHHDLVFGDTPHTPTMSVAGKDDRIVMLTAASKTFNIASLKNSFVVISDPAVRAKWDDFMQGLRIGGGSPFGYIAAEAAYRHGSAWLDDILDIIKGNYEYIVKRFAEDLPEVRVTPLDATYLAWLDFGAYLDPDEIVSFMQDDCRLAFDYGSWFGGDKSGSFIRVNLATSRANIAEMADRIVSSMSRK